MTRRPFTKPELQAWYPAWVSGDGDWSLYWITVLGMHSGARIGEPAQLSAADIHDVEGVLCLEIHKRTEGTTVKSDARERWAPLHPEVIRLGFLEYVEARRDAEGAGAKLFPHHVPFPTAQRAVGVDRGQCQQKADRHVGRARKRRCAGEVYTCRRSRPGPSG